MIIAAAYWSRETSDLGFAISSLGTQNNLAVEAAYLFVTKPSGYSVGKATQKWREELSQNEDEGDSLKNAGIWIGILERLFILTFFLMNTLETIGFLIAAKSILRCNNKDETNPSKQIEYVLIGTLISFLIALGVGILLICCTSSN